jgi:hypothetical protein
MYTSPAPVCLFAGLVIEEYLYTIDNMASPQFAEGKIVRDSRV